MLPLSDADRAVLTAPRIEVTYGCHVVDDSGAEIEDAPDLIDGRITHDAYDAVQRMCQLDFDGELDWENVWVRPWQALTAGGHTVKANLGVFRLSTPVAPLGREPRIWSATGYDRTSLLNEPIGDTRVSAAGMDIASQIRATIAEADVPGRILIPGDMADTVLDRDMVWALDIDNPATFLDRVNDLSASVGGQAVWMTGDGDYRIQRFRPIADRAVAFTLDVAAVDSIVEIDRTLRIDNFQPYNWWRFVRANMQARPTEGNGQYTVDMTSGGRRVARMRSLSVADQASLEAQADQMIAEDRGFKETISVTIAGFNVVEHLDVIEYRDPSYTGGRVKTQCRRWDLELRSGLNRLDLEVPNG